MASMTSREFAVEVVGKLQGAGYTALWAGGCVRDQLYGKTPKDYDVATNAKPEQVRELFGHKKTLAIGESFGVITVLGPKSADPIEVATFRRDTGYSDGRRPDAVEFTDAREDAIRRDFTINGMFFDPIAEEVIDYVGGQEDLNLRVIRAIGKPQERIEEDKLRMLRAIRFAATFDFAIESETLAAIQKHAAEIKVVSGERIGAELRRMLGSDQRAVAVRLLRESKLFPEILSGSEVFENGLVWDKMMASMERLEQADFATATSVLVEPIGDPIIVEVLSNSWKISNDEKKTIDWVLRNKATLAKADKQPWSAIQPLLIQDEARAALKILKAEQERPAAVEFCEDRFTWPSIKLDPKPLLNGNDLRKLRIHPGPLFGEILKKIRQQQLDGMISTREEAEKIAKQMGN